MDIVSKLQGYGPLVFGLICFLVGYVAGELDGWAFILVALVVGGGLAYRRRTARTDRAVRSPKGFL